MMSASLSMRAFVHRFLIALIVNCVLTAALIVGVVAGGNVKVANIHTVKIDPKLLQEGGNFLIIGSDTRAFADSPLDQDQFGSPKVQSGQRSDTIMVAHLDPGKRTGILVSFPRDLWVPIPGHGTAKINAAFAFGGPSLTIATIEQNFNIPISHYLEVDFAGFRNIVNAIGSVPIYFPTPARDRNTGLLVPTAGCQSLKGDQALAYVRSRYYEYYANGHWRYDPTSDIGRISRQQNFIRSLSHAAIKSVISNPFRLNRVVDKTVASLTRDSKLGSSALRGLALAFRNTDPKAFPMYTLPSTNAFRGNQSVLLLNAAKAAPTLARLRPAAPKAGPVPKIAASTVQLLVKNGSGVRGAASRVRASLAAAGFRLTGPAVDADRSDYAVTEVRYGPGAQTKARVVRAHLGGAGKIVPGSPPSGTDVVVVIGRDFQQVKTPSTAPKSPPSARTTRPAGPTTTTGPPANPGGPVPVAGC